jgi:hypothetical protein
MLAQPTKSLFLGHYLSEKRYCFNKKEITMRIPLILFVLFNVLFANISYARSQFTLPESASLHTLTIRTTPRNAKINILNMKLNYRHGIKLGAGNYRIEVSAQGYQPKKHTIRMRHHHKNIRITLRKKNVAKTPAPTQQTSSSSPHATADFIATTKGYLRFLRHANRLKGVSFTTEAEKFEKYCKRYSTLAIRQARRRMTEGCATKINFFKNDIAHQWSLQKAPQRAWCKTVSAYATAKEATYRERRLKDCLVAK